MQAAARADVPSMLRAGLEKGHLGEESVRQPPAGPRPPLGRCVVVRGLSARRACQPGPQHRLQLIRQEAAVLRHRRRAAARRLERGRRCLMLAVLPRRPLVLVPYGIEAVRIDRLRRHGVWSGSAIWAPDGTGCRVMPPHLAGPLAANHPAGAVRAPAARRLQTRTPLRAPVIVSANCKLQAPCCSARLAQCARPAPACRRWSRRAPATAVQLTTSQSSVIPETSAAAVCGSSIAGSQSAVNASGAI